MSRRLEVIPVDGLPEIEAGTSLGTMLAAAAPWLAAGDVVCIAQKAVSKAEGRTVDLTSVTPGQRATDLAAATGRDARMVELVLSESVRVIRAERSALIVETRSGSICANAGIDSSNVPGDTNVTLLPKDPDASARQVRADIDAQLGFAPAVLVSDSFGRPWRLGQADVAIGLAGLDPLDDRRGRTDRHGAELLATIVATADHLAAAADLARDKDSGTPAVVVRGLSAAVTEADGPGAAAIRRPASEDLFRD